MHNNFELGLAKNNLYICKNKQHKKLLTRTAN